MTAMRITPRLVGEKAASSSMLNDGGEISNITSEAEKQAITTFKEPDMHSALGGRIHAWAYPVCIQDREAPSGTTR